MDWKFVRLQGVRPGSAEHFLWAFHLYTDSSDNYGLTLSGGIDMETYKTDEKLVVRMDRGEEVFDKLEELRDEYAITGGFFQAIGAVDRVTLAHYNVDTQEYREQEFTQPFEVTNFAGNIGPDKIHAHITVADDSYQVKAGHCSEARVSGTFEMVILLSDEPVLEHAHDEETGLDLFDLS